MKAKSSHKGKKKGWGKRQKGEKGIKEEFTSTYLDFLQKGGEERKRAFGGCHVH